MVWNIVIETWEGKRNMCRTIVRRPCVEWLHGDQEGEGRIIWYSLINRFPYIGTVAAHFILVMALLNTLPTVYWFLSPLKQSICHIFVVSRYLFCIRSCRKQSRTARDDPPGLRLGIETKRPAHYKTAYNKNVMQCLGHAQFLWKFFNLRSGRSSVIVLFLDT